MILSKKGTAGDVYLVGMLLPQRSGVAVHIHDFENEIFHVLVGEITLTLGENIVHTKAGDMRYLLKSIPHGIHSSGLEITRILNHVIPGENFEDFFDQMHVTPIDATHEEKEPLEQSMLSDLSRHSQSISNPPLAIISIFSA